MENCLSIIKKLSWLYLILLIIFACEPSAYDVLRHNEMMSNVNDVAVYIAACYPIFFYDTLKNNNGKSMIFCILSIIVLVLLWRKLATAGIVLESLYMLMTIHKKTTIKKYIYSLILFSVFGILCLLYYDLINKFFQMMEMVISSAEYIYDANIFSKINSSQTYRISVFVYGIQELIDSNFVGIGIGNATYLLRIVMPLGNYMDIGDGTTPVHNFIIQILLEFGFVSVLFVLIILRYLVIAYRDKNMYSQVFITMLISVWIWFLAPSKFYTTYYVYLCFAYFMAAIKTKNSLK